MKLYLALVGASLRSHMAYRTAFILKVIALILSYSATIITTWAALEAFTLLGGWTFPEIALLYGFGVLAYGVASMLFWEMRSVASYVRYGALDTVLIKPVPALFFIVARRIEPTAIAHIFVGSSLLIWAMKTLGLNLNAIELQAFFLYLASAIVLLSSFHILSGALSFWLITSKVIWDIQVHLREMSWYPLNIFPNVVQVFFLTLYPLAFSAYLPVIYVLDSDYTGISSSKLVFTSPVLATIFLVIALYVWKLGIRRYAGTGS